jgi:Fur family ferric uptake transcriptional regulator
MLSQQEVLDRFHARLGASGLKSTQQRDVIVARFFELGRHISVEEAPRIGYATVYRTLKLLVEHRFATPRQFGDGQTRFDPADGDDEEHDHIICLGCRRVLEFSDPTITARIQGVVAAQGEFELARQRLELYVHCKTEACPHLAAATHR